MERRVGKKAVVDKMDKGYPYSYEESNGKRREEKRNWRIVRKRWVKKRKERKNGRQRKRKWIK